jgi:hypothetical protein
MSNKWLSQYRTDPLIRSFELTTSACSWRDNSFCRDADA